MTHTILFLAANPGDTQSLALDRECAAIERELRMTRSRDDFAFRSKWAVTVDDLMRHLNEEMPAILHFSGHGGAGGSGGSKGGVRRDVEPLTGAPGAGGSSSGSGIWLQEGDRSQFVSDRALAKIVAATSPTTRLVVLNACYSASVAEALCHHVDCVVGMDGAIADIAARSFAVAFYRALGNHRSIRNAVDQAVAALAAKGHDDVTPICKTRQGVDAERIFLSQEPIDVKPPPSQAAKPEPRVTQQKSASPSQVPSDDLLNRLLRLLSSQFETVVFRMGVPSAHLSGSTAPQAMRAIELIRWAGQQPGKLDQLARILDDV